MRWRVLMALFILFAILAGGLFLEGRVNQICRQVETLLMLHRETADGRLLEQALLQWEQAQPLLSSLLHQQRLEDVGQGLAQGLGALQAGDQGSCMMKIEGVLYLLDDIREYDHILWKTLF